MDVYSVWNEEAVAITVSINDIGTICTEWKFLQILGIKWVIITIQHAI